MEAIYFYEIWATDNSKISLKGNEKQWVGY